MSEDLDERRLWELVNRLDSRLNTVRVLAEVLLDNAAMREGIPGPYLDNVKESALMEAVIYLSRSNEKDFLRLAKMEKLPLV
ncbi:hypothetical protein [Metapseudomonas resinovorans]|uniref:Uncharacterized protein n=1 Tax=Metapseudomonas resinovorans NBRC 106553 TaxID=1245471 RepID=S6AGG3_METRE|nr:hypothetical protein [Pseudomonas resinovorans]BAN47100.1 hypothetical protein PCA10_13680 [Pseudomonas resinovorans NBRC 106553]